MKRIVTSAIFVIVLIFSCISQKNDTEEWTVEKWRDHLFFPNPNIDQCFDNIAVGLCHLETLPVGTYLAFKGKMWEYSLHTAFPYDFTMDITILDKEVVDGKECTVAKITMESSFIKIEAKEWMDSDGTPMKIEEEVRIQGIDTVEVMRFFAVLKREAQYRGYDCWVFSGTCETGTLFGTGMGELGVHETHITAYIDKESYAQVGMITERGISESGFYEPDTRYIEGTYAGLKWELGPREGITTELGTFDCQVIYLKDNGRTVGTIWANEKIRTPLKYIVYYEQEATKYDMTLTLIEYIWGCI